ncbi:hypothetical protein ACMT1E_14890 [Sphingomonas flavalba]|uniref:hypothetical protein n=1 Tax=Sphingomonas flavalba TaxID=2559804 RepID=UPI0039E02BC9
MSAADDIRADIDSLRGRGGRDYRSPSRRPVSASRIRQHTGICLTVLLLAASALMLFGVIRLAIAVGGAILHFAWPSHRLGQVLVDLLF